MARPSRLALAQGGVRRGACRLAMFGKAEHAAGRQLVDVSAFFSATHLLRAWQHSTLELEHPGSPRGRAVQPQEPTGRQAAREEPHSKHSAVHVHAAQLRAAPAWAQRFLAHRHACVPGDVQVAVIATKRLRNKIAGFTTVSRQPCIAHEKPCGYPELSPGGGACTSACRACMRFAASIVPPCTLACDIHP